MYSLLFGLVLLLWVGFVASIRLHAFLPVLTSYLDLSVAKLKAWQGKVLISYLDLMSYLHLSLSDAVKVWHIRSRYDIRTFTCQAFSLATDK